jgi:hypothetical protein
MSEQLHRAPLKTPFEKIALALSGGGFRAASYSIGTMSYLHHLKYSDKDGEERSLLDNVDFISSASGGTFAGMLYSAYTKKGISFGQVYKDMLEFMKGQTLLEDVLKLINDDKEWEDGEKSRNFINAFAKIYDQRLFNGETFGVYWGEGIEEKTGKSGADTGGGNGGKTASQKRGNGLPRDIEVCFNATEFYRGLSFRWQTGGTVPAASGSIPVDGMTGNKYIHFDKDSKIGLEALKQIKLGDIMASSSCFPAGFEPIIYPRDFTYTDKDDVKKGKGLASSTLEQAMIITDYNNRPRALDCSIGLMDGGVDDNQGVYSAMLADQRRRTLPANHPRPDNGFDLVMVVDVASYFMDPYVVPAPVSKGSLRKKNVADLLKGWAKDFKKVSGILKVAGIVSVVVLIAAILLLAFAEPGGWTNLGFLLLSPAILLLLLVAIAVGYKAASPLVGKLSDIFGASDKQIVSSLKEGVPAVANFSDEALGYMVKYLKDAPIGVLEQMGKARVDSMLSLLLDINLKQTRRLIFDIFYGNFYGQDIWGNRRVFNVIYELSLFNIASRESTLRNKFIPKPPAALDGTASTPDTVSADAGTVLVPVDKWGEYCVDLLLKKCEKLNSVAEQARTMGTTLWYDKEDSDSQRMDKVVACGQFTTCAKMLEYTLVLERTLEMEKDLPFTERTLQFGDFDLDLFGKIRKQLEDDWKAFKADPFILL